jgi:putative aldouronate transport system permease protein
LQLGDIGMSSAAGFYQSIVGFVVVLLSNMMVRKVNPENALF